MYQQFDQKKLEATMAVFEDYECRFAQARMNHPHRTPWQEPDREEIRKALCDVLRLDQKLIPEIRICKEQTQKIHGITARHMLFESWKGFYGIATLLIPEKHLDKKQPAVMVCPGHGEEGRLTASYQQMGITLAKQGAYALILENIGQGSRKAFGHWLVPEVFYCGLTLQGLIVAEACGWINWLRAQPFVDETRIGACGNSGGGTETLMLAGLSPHLAAIASSGYPSEFPYLLQKERRHCDCNLLPGVCGRLEMWEIYSLFAPRPLFLECGTYDDLLPVDLFHRNARKVAAVYHLMGAGANFRAGTTPEKHSWATADIQLIADFFADVFALVKTDAVPEDGLIRTEDVTLSFPADALSTAEGVQRMTGKQMPAGMTLADLFVPMFRGEKLDLGTIIPNLGRGDVMRVLAQQELALYK